MDTPVAILGSIRRPVAGAIVAVVVGACSIAPGPGATGTPSPTATAFATFASATASPGPTAVPSASAAPAPTVLPSSSAAAIPSQAVGSWTLEAVLAGFEVRDLATRSDTIVAVGCLVPAGATDCSGAAIQTWIDGGWIAAQLEGDTRPVRLRAVAAGAAGFVAVGIDQTADGADTEAITFASTDGRTWRRAPDQASLHRKGLTDVVARPGGGWLAVGAEAGPTVFMGIDTWTSTDGLRWTLIDSMPQVGIARGVASLKDGFITWGTDCLDVCGPPKRAALWRTKDGQAWARVASQPSLAGAEVIDIIATSQGALAVGQIYDSDANPTGSAWLTVDGAAWTRVALPDATGFRSFRVVTTGTGYVTVGVRSGDTGEVWGTWTATDPATWHRLSDGDVRAGSFALVTSDGDVLGAAVAEPPAPSQTAILRLAFP